MLFQERPIDYIIILKLLTKQFLITSLRISYRRHRIPHTVAALLIASTMF